MKCMRVFLMSSLALAMVAEAATEHEDGSGALRRSSTVPVFTLERSATISPEEIDALAARRRARADLIRDRNGGVGTDGSTLSRSPTVPYSPVSSPTPDSPASAGVGFTVVPVNPGGSHSQSR